MKKVFLTLFSFLFVLAGCGLGSEMNGTYNAYSSSSNYSGFGSLATIDISNSNAKMTVQYYEIDISRIEMTEKQTILTGTIDESEKTMTFTDKDGKKVTFDYTFSDGKLSIEGDAFAKSTSKEFSDNKKSFTEAGGK